MATQTTVLDLTKPSGSENALISVINSNMDKVDAEAGKVRGNVAADYSTSSAYAVGALCIYGGNLYSCNTAIGIGGEAWNAAHWTQVTIAGELAGVAAEIPEVVDNLTTTSSTKALSAGQGKALSDQIANFNKVFYSTTAAYGGAGSVSYDLSGYSAVIVMFRSSDIDATIYSVAIPVGKTGRGIVPGAGYSRDYTVSTSGVSWTASNHPSYPNAIGQPQMMIAI